MQVSRSGFVPCCEFRDYCRLLFPNPGKVENGVTSCLEVNHPECGFSSVSDFTESESSIDQGCFQFLIAFSRSSTRSRPPSSSAVSKRHARLSRIVRSAACAQSIAELTRSLTGKNGV